MKSNMGTPDKVARLLVAAAIATLYYTNIISGTLAIVLGSVGVIFTLTSFIGFCPLYFPFGISTKPKA
jgi:hypothetical protein